MDLHIAEMHTELDTKLALRKRTTAGLEQAIATKEERLRVPYAPLICRRRDADWLRPRQSEIGCSASIDHKTADRVAVNLRAAPLPIL